MGTHKKEKNRKERQGATGDGMGNVKVKGENFYRSATKVKVLKRLTDGKAQRNASGKITKAASYQSREAPVARVEPNRKWFNNTRVISQDALDSFRSAVQAQTSDPTSFLLKRNKLPMSLIEEKKNVNGLKEHQAKITVETQSYGDTFGPKAQRKRPKIDFDSIESLADRTGEMQDQHIERLEHLKLLSGTSGEENADGEIGTAREHIFSKGTSRRIWNELYKVIDSSDVLLHVLDARDPLGTRCRAVEKYVREEAPHKHLVFVLNKVDLVPSRIAAQWIRILSKDHPTLAFHASINNSFGKGSLIALLRQFSQLHSDRKQVSVGLIGYPNVGKSSIVNTLRNKPVCTVAPIAGETKVWQYVTLMKRIFLIDCPGIVPPNQNETDEELLLRGSVRVENIEWPAQYIETVLERCQPKHLQRTYEVSGYSDSTGFLELLCRKQGRLLKGGEPDLDAVAKIVLNDWIRGKIPWYKEPPSEEGTSGGAVKKVGGREGRLGEMPLKRKRGEESEAAESVAADGEAGSSTEVEEEEDEDEFKGFSGDEDEDVGSDIEESVGDDEKQIQEEMNAISEALAKARKKQRKD